MAEETEHPPTRVLLVDDYESNRKVLSRWFSRQRGVVVVGEATTGEEAIAMAHQHAPDVVVMDVVMPGMGGVEATRRLVQELPAVRVIGHSANDEGAAMGAAGAIAFVRKGEPPHLLLDAIRSVGL